MPTIAIVCDNYKIQMFKKRLDRQKIRYEITPMTINTSIFKCYDTRAVDHWPYY